MTCFLWVLVKDFDFSVFVIIDILYILYFFLIFVSCIQLIAILFYMYNCLIRNFCLWFVMLCICKSFWTSSAQLYFLDTSNIWNQFRVHCSIISLLMCRPIPILMNICIPDYQYYNIIIVTPPFNSSNWYSSGFYYII